MVMYSRILHLKVNGSSTAVLTGFDCDRAMRDCEFSEKGKTDTQSLCVCVFLRIRVVKNHQNVWQK